MTCTSAAGSELNQIPRAKIKIWRWPTKQNKNSDIYTQQPIQLYVWKKETDAAVRLIVNLC